MKELFIYTLILFSVNVQSQNLNHQLIQKEEPPTCGSSGMEERINLLYPELIKKQKVVDDNIRESIYGSNSTMNKMGTLYTIPVVVHIVHKGSAVGVAENISDAQVIQGITDMNNAFRNIGFYDPSTGVDCEIEFCLASQDESGNFTTGITRTNNSTYSDHFSSTEETDLKATIAPQWDPTSYCNIWIVNSICTSPGFECGTAGYAYKASAHGQSYDGIVNEAAYFGSSQDNSKVHVHEMGHYLNLDHTFKNGCTNDDCTTDNDQVCDTPPDNSTTAVSCPGTANSCDTDDDDLSTSNPFRPIGSGGLGNQNDMYENYMDYGYQSCQDRYTAGQSTRMRTAITVARSSLLSSVGCIDPSSPVVYFASSAVSESETGNAGVGGCNRYKDVNVTMSIAAAPTGDALITVGYAGTATGGGVDYTAGTGPEVTFLDGDDSDQTFTIRIWDDASIESEETIILTYTISAGTDAAPAGFSQSETITISDNDKLPATAGVTYLLNENFESGIGSWSTVYFNPEYVNRWNVGNDGVVGSASAYISMDGGITHSYNNTSREQGLASVVLDATGITADMTLSLDMELDGDGVDDYAEIRIRSLGANGDNFWYSYGASYSPLSNINGNYSIILPASLKGNTFEIAFFWVNNGATINSNPLAIDNVKIFVDGQSSIVESSLSSVDVPFGPNATVYVYNGDDTEIVARVTNLSAHDYGCTTFAIDRAGSSALKFRNDQAMNFATSKTLLVTPTNNNPTGSYQIRLYYTAAEIAGWESATGQVRANLAPFKNENAISTQNGTAVFGTNNANGVYNTTSYYSEADFSTGFSGFASMLAEGSSGSLLSINLLNYEAIKVDNNALLNWKAVNPDKFSHFEIERSNDSKNFEFIGKVDFDKNESLYRSKDYNTNNGDNFYRLKMVDNDGTFSYSQVRKLVFEKEEISLYPNPFNSVITLDGLKSQASIKIVNVVGQIILEKELTNGDNQISTSDLVDGTYIVTIRTENNTFVEKLIKSTK